MARPKIDQVSLKSSKSMHPTVWYQPKLKIGVLSEKQNKLKDKKTRLGANDEAEKELTLESY